MSAHPHLDADVAARWRARRLSPPELLAAADHLERCAECRARVAQHQPEEVAADLQRQLVVPSPALPRPVWMLATAAALALAVLGGFAIWRQLHAGNASARAAAAPPSLAFRDGAGRVTLDARGGVQGIPAAWQPQVAAALRQPELVTPPAARALMPLSEAQRGAHIATATAVVLESPRARVVLTPRPTFRWRPMRGGVERWRVDVYDPTFATVATSGAIEGSSWTPQQPLPRATTLTWTVTALDGAGETAYPQLPDPPAQLVVAPAEVVAQVEAARASGSRLVLALALWHAGALDEAVAELRALEAQNPDVPVLARLAASGERALVAARGAAPAGGANRSQPSPITPNAAQ